MDDNEDQERSLRDIREKELTLLTNNTEQIEKLLEVYKLVCYGQHSVSVGQKMLELIAMMHFRAYVLTKELEKE